MCDDHNCREPYIKVMPYDTCKQSGDINASIIHRALEFQLSGEPSL